MPSLFDYVQEASRKEIAETFPPVNRSTKLINLRVPNKKPNRDGSKPFLQKYWARLVHKVMAQMQIIAHQVFLDLMEAYHLWIYNKRMEQLTRLIQHCPTKQKDGRAGPSKKSSTVLEFYIVGRQLAPIKQPKSTTPFPQDPKECPHHESLKRLGGGNSDNEFNRRWIYC